MYHLDSILKSKNFAIKGPSSQGSVTVLVIFAVFHTDNAEKAMAHHSSTLAWKIPWTEEPGRLQSMGSLRVRHD